ncbi:MAG: tRNA (adenosine(37)-N6)-threonylcarbamoyltransferase complex transferase subunit TsaD, partial [Candidatus Omnitrophota bacterium]
MIVVGVETSCDETGVGIVRNGRTILANTVVSSLKLHSRYGGVIPEIASRLQLESIAGVYLEAMRSAGAKEKDIGLIAVTRSSGLPGSLLVGNAFAKALAAGLKKPLIGIDHVHSHIYANFLCHEGIRFPCVALVVSGGHTSIFYMKDFSAIRLLGQTRDDACGEAFDKVAKIMGLGYPGGPLIEKLALRGDGKKIRFSCSGVKGEFDFSFSGIKTAVMYRMKKKTPADGYSRADIAASFQDSVTGVLVEKSLLACSRMKSKYLLVGGGVAANKFLRDKMSAAARKAGVNC